MSKRSGQETPATYILKINYVSDVEDQCDTSLPKRAPPNTTSRFCAKPCVSCSDPSAVQVLYEGTARYISGRTCPKYMIEDHSAGTSHYDTLPSSTSTGARMPSESPIRPRTSMLRSSAIMNDDNEICYSRKDEGNHIWLDCHGIRGK
jgi:hypothetical protein